MIKGFFRQRQAALLSVPTLGQRPRPRQPSAQHRQPDQFARRSGSSGTFSCASLRQLAAMSDNTVIYGRRDMRSVAQLAAAAMAVLCLWHGRGAAQKQSAAAEPGAAPGQGTAQAQTTVPVRVHSSRRSPKSPGATSVAPTNWGSALAANSRRRTTGVSGCARRQPPRQAGARLARESPARPG
jgi:hypothetical protein